MLKVNGDDVIIEKSITISELVYKLKNDSYNNILLNQPFMIVVNKEYIFEEKYDTYTLSFEDDIIIIPLIAGG